MLTRHLDTLMTSFRTKLAVLGTISALALMLLFGAEAHAQAPAKKCVSLESKSIPGQYVRHTFFLGRVDPVVGDLGQKDASFVQKPGLARPAAAGFASFESVNFPGFYLRHFAFGIVLAKNDGTDQFKKDATFKVHPGLADKTLASFEAINFPGFFIRQWLLQGLVIGLAVPGDTSFDAAATFKPVDGVSKAGCEAALKRP
ncbi:MAG TPA: AbfB domain-containing protein [Kofleriaceae bacterium]|nr:AbfB domain-containing protein [Kofleriaceae bacterium]